MRTKQLVKHPHKQYENKSLARNYNFPSITVVEVEVLLFPNVHVPAKYHYSQECVPEIYNTIGMLSIVLQFS